MVARALLNYRRDGMSAPDVEAVVGFLSCAANCKSSEVLYGLFHGDIRHRAFGRDQMLFDQHPGQRAGQSGIAAGAIGDPTP